MLHHLYIFIAGVVFGLANVIPGVSGGTMAVVFGVYERLINLIANIRRDFKKELPFIIAFGAGAVAGILAFGKLMKWILVNHAVEANAFFIGVILGSIPVLVGFAFKKASKRTGKTSWVFNLGISRRIQYGQPVQKVIGEKFGLSMKIGLISLAFSLVIGVWLGVLQANYKDGVFDHIGMAYTVFVNAVPHLVSYSLILIIGNQLFGLPAVYSSRDELRSLILPIICLSLGSTAGYMLWMRRYMVDELNKDYIRLAKLKGLSSRKIMFRHVLRNAFVPLAQYLPYSILLTVGGSLLVESFFAIPGMGPMLSQAIPRYDLNLVQAIVMLYASLGVIGVFLGDLLMCLFDPRISLVGKGDAR